MMDRVGGPAVVTDRRFPGAGEEASGDSAESPREAVLTGALYATGSAAWWSRIGTLLRASR
jgi:hypothetical protein